MTWAFSPLPLTYSLQNEAGQTFPSVIYGRGRLKMVGLDFGTVGTSMIFLTTLVRVVGCLTITRKDPH